MNAQLPQVDQLGLIGDTHGDLRFARAAISELARRGVRTAVQLGDFGFVWGQQRSGLNDLSRILNDLDFQLFFVDGNHEDFDTLLAIPISDDGIRWVAPRIGHLPRGTRFDIRGRSFAVMGGANSIDHFQRQVGVSWWAEESISDADLATLGSSQVDVLLGHDAPEPLRDLDRYLQTTKRYWPMPELAYAARGRRTFTRAFMAVRPALYVGGHYHRFVDQQAAYSDEARSFSCRVVVLGMNEGGEANVAVLNPAGLEVAAFHV